MKSLIIFFSNWSYKKIIYSYIFIFLFSLLCESILNNFSYPFVLNASIEELKVWYPRFYGIIYLISLLYYSLSFIFFIISTSILITRHYIPILFKILIPITGILLLTFTPFSIVSILLFYILMLSFFHNKAPENLQPTSSLLIIKNEKILLFFFIVFAFTLRLVWILNTDNSGNGDAGMRLMGTQKWINLISIIGLDKRPLHPFFIMPSVDWLPLHYWLIGITNVITSDWIYSPRILSAIFGSLTLIPLYKLSKMKFNREVALIAIVIFTFYGYHIFISSLTLSEPFYIFFLIISYYLVEKWLQFNSNKTLIQLGVSLAALCLLRYEGWFFSFFMVLILPFINKKVIWRKYFVFASIVFSSTLFIMLMEIWYGEHPLRGILYSDYEVKIALNHSHHSLKNIFDEYINSYIPFSIISIFLLGYFYFRNKEKQNLALMLLYLIPLFPFIYKLSNGTLTAQARYMTLYMIPFIPFVAFVLYKSFVHLNLSLKIVWLIVFIFIMNISFYNQLNMGYPLLTYKKGFHQSAKYIKQLDKVSIYLDTEEQWGEYNWMIEANATNFPPNILELYNLKYSYKRNVLCLVEQDKVIGGNWDKTNFDKLISNRDIDHIILFPNGDLNNYLNFKNKNEFYKGIHLVRVFNQDGYLIYKIID